MDADYRGFIDSAVGPEIRGWALKVGSDSPICVKITCGSEVKVVVADVYRQDLEKNGVHKTGLCGYKVSFSKNNFNVAKVEVLQEIRELERSRQYYTDRKILLIHLPKTAGTSLNSIMKKVLPDGDALDHIEGHIDKWNGINKRKFLSGHIQFDQYENYFKRHQYICAVLFREPISQLASHLNWVRHIEDVKDSAFAQKHPDVVKNIARTLSRLDYSNVQTMNRFARGLPKGMYGLFDNMQVRFMANVPGDRKVNKDDLDTAIRNLAHVQLPGLTENFNQFITFLKEVTGIKIHTNKVVHENKAKYTYGFDTQDNQLQKAVEPLIIFDNQLYDAAKTYFYAKTT